MSQKHERLEQVLRQAAAEYINRESNRSSLITVTGVHVTDDFSRARILVSVLPEEKEEEVLAFLRRSRSDLREELEHSWRMGKPPFIDFSIDNGEKNRQAIETLST